MASTRRVDRGARRRGDSPLRTPRRRYGGAFAFACAAALALAGCASDTPTQPVDPSEPHVPDPVRGAARFAESCAGCHVNRDAFDLARFGFTEDDIVRRGVSHVDTAAARDIAAHVAGLAVTPVGRDHRLFQPGGRVVASDEEAWASLFGTTGWPEGLTPAALASLDLRDVPVSVPFPVWSSESDQADWLPEHPLPALLLDRDGGALRAALAAYEAAGTLDALIEMVGVFEQAASRDLPGTTVSFCAHVAERIVPCFEAHRWVASLTALHLMRTGPTREVPYAIASLWWDVGAAGRAAFHEAQRYPGHRTAAAAWLYMASVFHPAGFERWDGLAEPGGYMGQFLQTDGHPRAAVLATVRRMVSDDVTPIQRYWDLDLATVRAPPELLPGLLEFGLDHLLDVQTRGVLPRPDRTGRAMEFLRRAVDRWEGRNADPARWRAIRDRLARLEEGLVGGGGPS